MESGLLCKDCDYLMELLRMLCSSLAKSLMTALVRHRRHPEIRKFSAKTEDRMPPCAQLSVRSCAHMGLLHTSNPCRWKPTNNDPPGDQVEGRECTCQVEGERKKEREGTKNTFGN